MEMLKNIENIILTGKIRAYMHNVRRDALGASISVECRETLFSACLRPFYDNFVRFLVVERPSSAIIA